MKAKTACWIRDPAARVCCYALSLVAYCGCAPPSALPADEVQPLRSARTTQTDAAVPLRDLDAGSARSSDAGPVVDGTLQGDAAARAGELTPSLVHLEYECLGDALYLSEEAGTPMVDGGLSCHDCHRPCHAWREDYDCEAEPGCRWEQVEVINEGTDTGKRCEGEAMPCLWVGACQPGCIETKIPDSARTRGCEGTPTPCETYQYSEDCSNQWGCHWR